MIISVQNITIGIITALPEEYASVRAILNNTQDYYNEGKTENYIIGEINTLNNNKIYVSLLLLPDMGNNISAIKSSQLLSDFPSINYLIMVGIAVGVPNPSKPNDHVRLGDIIISDKSGVKQYDNIKKANDHIEYRFPPRPPSAILLKKVKELQSKELAGDRPWNEYTNQILKVFNWSRPSEDILLSSEDNQTIIDHPEDQLRRPEEPKDLSWSYRIR